MYIIIYQYQSVTHKCCSLPFSKYVLVQAELALAIMQQFAAEEQQQPHQEQLAVRINSQISVLSWQVLSNRLQSAASRAPHNKQCLFDRASICLKALMVGARDFAFGVSPIRTKL